MFERWADAASRPATPTTNQVGFNEDTQSIEQYDGASWVTLAGGTSNALNPNRIGFYDRFDDLRRYPDGSEVTDGVTMPIVGSAWAWKKNDSGAPSDIKMVVSNGGLRPRRLGGGYLSAEATPADRTNFSYGFEFTREATRHTTGSVGLTVTVGKAPLTNGSTHNAWGRWHVNMSSFGLSQPSIFQAAWNVNADIDADTFTITGPNNPAAVPNPPTIETGDYVVLSGPSTTMTSGVTNGTNVITFATNTRLVNGMKVTGTNIPADTTILSFTTTSATLSNAATGSGSGITFTATGLPDVSAAGPYWAIKDSENVYRLATSRAYALSGNAISISWPGVNVTLAREMEFLNRIYRTSGYSWLPEKSESRLVSFTSGTDTITTNFPHGFKANDPGIFEGDALGGGLVAGQIYYVRDVTSTSFKVSLTPGGTAVDITTNGSPNQLFRGTSTNESSNAWPLNRRNIILFTVRGDEISITLVGVGTIRCYFRNMSELMGDSGPVGFYWQCPPEQSTGLNFTEIYALHAAWIDAPAIEAAAIQRYGTYLATLATESVHELPGRLMLIPPGGGPASGPLGSLLVQSNGSTGVRDASIGFGETTVFGSDTVTRGGHRYAAGLWLSNPTFSSAGGSLIGVAPATIQNIDGSVSSAAGAETAIAGTMSMSGMQTGEFEEHTICGYLVGPNAKRIRLTYSTFELSGNVFDSDFSGTPLNALATPFVIRVERKQTATHDHQTYATMYVNGTVIGPQRMALNLGGSYRYLQVRTTTADAGGVVIDQFRTTIHHTKPRL
jgi:hypothetical protein